MDAHRRWKTSGKRGQKHVKNDRYDFGMAPRRYFFRYLLGTPIPRAFLATLSAIHHVFWPYRSARLPRGRYSDTVLPLAAGNVQTGDASIAGGLVASNSVSGVITGHLSQLRAAPTLVAVPGGTAQLRLLATSGKSNG
jgi:hypothetical protein